jgi:hypothetical protein
LSPTKDFAIFNGHRVELEDGDIVLLNGTVFKNEIGIVNQTMTDIFADRKKYKGYMNVEHEDLEMFKKELKTLEEELLLCLQN